jgi:uncharacterized membrane protein YgcG
MRVTRGVPAVLLGLLVLLACPPARADGPMDLTTQITDRVEALDGRRGEVETALNRLRDEQKVKLFVVYVKDFSGAQPADWAHATAQRSGMGRRDLVLAVATGSRRYALSADADFTLSDQQLDRVAAIAVEPALAQNDWAGAAVGAADGLNAELAGQPVPTPAVRPGTADPGSKGSSLWWLLLLVLLVVLVVGIVLVVRRRRRRGSPQDGPGLAELDGQANHLLLKTDDAIRTSNQDVGFAEAQYGAEAVAPFKADLGFAQEQLTAAFRLRQQLDDDVPDTPQDRRRWLEQIVAACTEANRRLDEHAAAFDRLRDLEATAPQVAQDVAATHQALTARLPAVREELVALGGRYAPSALALVTDAPEQAQSRLDFTAQNLAQARAALTAGDSARAALFVQAAQSAADQAQQLLEGVHRRAQDLEAAEKALGEAVRDAEQDLVDARALMADARWQAELGGPVRQAETALAEVTHRDPPGELERLQAGTAGLDQVLAGVRDEQERQQRARAQLDQAAITAHSEIAAAQDFIATNRGAVGSTARTRLSESRRRLDKAVALATTDPAAALAEAEQAAALARQATQLAQQDVGGFGPARQSGGVFGSGSSVSGAVLGGILIDSVLRGGGRSNTPAPGSFGGVQTRGRRGTGGRF